MLWDVLQLCSGFGMKFINVLILWKLLYRKKAVLFVIDLNVCLGEGSVFKWSINYNCYLEFHKW
jgi:hypothetical protein